MKKALLALLFVVAACGQTSTALNPMWSVSLDGTDWTGVQCAGRNNLPGWMWGHVTKDAAGVPHVKLDYCDAASGKWQTIAWDNPAQGPQFSDAEVPAGAIDGKNAAFTLAHPPAAGSVPIVALNGVIQKLNGDYKLAGAAVTFGSAPAAGDSLTVWYRY